MQSWKRKTDPILSLSLCLGTRPLKQKNIDTGAQQKTHRQLHKHKKNNQTRVPHIDGNVSSSSSHLFLLQIYFSHFSFKSKTHVAEKVQRMTDQRKAGERSGPWPRQGPGRPFPREAAGSAARTGMATAREERSSSPASATHSWNLGFSGFICTTGVRSTHCGYCTQMVEENGDVTLPCKDTCGRFTFGACCKAWSSGTS